MEVSLQTLRDMASRLGATMTVLHERLISCSQLQDFGNRDSEMSHKNIKSKVEIQRTGEKRIAKVLIRKLRKDDRDKKSVTDLRLAVMGGHDAGKSTLLGIITFIKKKIY